MKIAIISDTHDHISNLNKVLDFIIAQKCEVLIHAGDLARTETLELICKKFNNPIYLVGGNADLNSDEIFDLVKKYKNLNYKNKTLEVELDKIKFAITHKPLDSKLLGASGKYDVVVHGHDHKPWQSFINKTMILNPGNLCDQRFDSTFAIYNTKTKTPILKILSKI